MEDNEAYNRAKRTLKGYYNTCPLCKWPTNTSRFHEGNRECIACLNNKGEWYDYKPKVVTEEMILYKMKSFKDKV